MEHWCNLAFFFLSNASLFSFLVCTSETIRHLLLFSDLCHCSLQRKFERDPQSEFFHYLEAQPHFYVTETEAIVWKDLCYLDITENHVFNKIQKRIQVTKPNWLTLKARFDLVKDRENSLCGRNLYHQIT